MRTPPITLPAVAALLVGAALVLPGRVDGFDDPLAVEGLEADVPAWFEHPGGRPRCCCVPWEQMRNARVANGFSGTMTLPKGSGGSPNTENRCQTCSDWRSDQ